jgi:hypothetical protein
MRKFGTTVSALLEPVEPRIHLSGSADLVHSATALSQARWNPAAVGVSDKAIFAGGMLALADAVPTSLSAVDVYDRRSGGLSVTSLPHARTVLAAAAGGKAVFVGTTQNRAVDIYDPAAEAWSTVRAPIWFRQVFSAMGVGDDIVFSGRSGGGARPEYRLVIFNARTGRWRKTPIPRSVDPTAAGTNGTSVVVAGGINGRIGIYDLLTRRWRISTLSPSVGPLGIQTALSIGTTVIFNAGAKAVLYDTITDEVSIKNLDSAYAAETTVGSKALLAGESGVTVYDASPREWSTTNLSQNRGAVGATTAGDTAIFAGGGEGNLFDPDNRSFSDTVDLFVDSAPVAVLAGGISGHARRNANVTVRNTGDAPLRAGSTVTVYASMDRTLSAAVPLGQMTLTDALAPGSSVQVKVKTSIPATLAPRNYHLLAAVDDHSGSAPTAIAAQAKTFTVTRAGANTAAASAASRFRGLFAR